MNKIKEAMIMVIVMYIFFDPKKTGIAGTKPAKKPIIKAKI